MKSILFTLLFTFYFLLGIIYTYPLILHINEGIPQGIFGGVSQYKGSDQLQLYFLSWLFKNNVTNGISPFVNQFIFSVDESFVFNTDSFSLPVILTSLFSVFFVDTVSFNLAFILLTFPIMGIVTFLLVNHYTDNIAASFIASLILTFAPFRLSQMLGGHIIGSMAFIVPLIIFLSELSFKKNNPWYSFLSGLSLFTFCFNEWHLMYYMLLFLIIYITFKLILFAKLCYVEKRRFKQERINYLNFMLNFSIGICAFVILSIIFSGGFQFSVFGIKISMRHIENPMLILIFFIIIKIFINLKLKIDNKVETLKIFFIGLKSATPLIIFCLFSVGYMLYLQFFHIGSSAALSGGRALSEVAYYSPSIADIFLRVNGNCEKYIYMGILPSLLCLLTIIRFSLLKWFPFNEKDDRNNIGFFIFIFFVSLILSLGTTLNPIFPLYKIFHKYLPFFNNQRVPSRIIILTFTSMIILSGYALKEIYKIIKGLNLNRLFQNVLIILLTISLGSCVFIDFHVMKGRGIAIHILDKDNKVYKFLKENNVGKVLELPLFNGQYPFATSYMYYSTITGARIINGYSGTPPDNFLKVFSELKLLNFGHLNVAQYNILKDLNVEYIVVHEKLFPNEVYDCSSIVPVYNFLNNKHLNFILQDKDSWLFSVLPAPVEEKEADNKIIDKIEFPNEYQFLTGWYPSTKWESGVSARWMSGKEAIYIQKVVPNRLSSLRMSYVAPVAQNIRIFLNEKELDKFYTDGFTEWEVYEKIIEPHELNENLAKVKIVIDKLFIPSEINPTINDHRELGIALSDLRLIQP